MMFPGSWLIWVSLCSKAPVGACVSGLGWLMMGRELMMIDSLPCATAQGPSVTSWLSTTDPVTLGPCALAHGNLSIIISSPPIISQPNPLTQGQTVVSQQSDIQINQEPGNIIQMPPSAQLTDVVRALNALGATPGDLLAILQAIKAAGALNAELEVI